jgi:hypothetical protein
MTRINRARRVPPDVRSAIAWRTRGGRSKPSTASRSSTSSGDIVGRTEGTAANDSMSGL